MAAKAEETQEATGLTAAEKRIQELEAQLKRALKKDEGWLITAKNPLYEGVSYGVLFNNGQAFIRLDQVVPAFVYTPEKDGTIRRRHIAQIKDGLLSEAEYKQIFSDIREREKRTSAEWAAIEFETLGYKVEFFDSTRLLELQDRMDEHMRQSQQLASIQSQQAANLPLVEPGYMGQRR